MRISTIAFKAALAAVIFGGVRAEAADGTWTNLSGGLWSDTANWSGGTVADGAGFTANFNTLDITAATTVSLDSSRTIGTLIFGDTAVGTAGGWTVNNNGNAANILTLGGAATVTVNPIGTGNTNNVTISAVIDGSSGLTKNGTGTVSGVSTNGTGILILSGANTYSGGTTISGGALRAINNSAVGTGAVTVASGAQFQLGNVTLANTINLNGSSALFASSGNSVTNGAINLQSNSTIYNTSNNNNTLNIAGGLNLGANTATISFAGSGSSTTISGAITGTGTLVKANSSNLTITSNQTATFSGAVNLTGGALLIGADGALGTGTFSFGTNDNPVTIRSTDLTARTLGNALVLLGNANSTFNFGSTTPAVNGNLNFSSTSDIALGATRRFQVHNRTTVAGAFTGTGVGLTMQNGVGTLALTGASTYTGATTVNAGTLLVNGSLSTTSAVAVNANGTLGGSGSVGAVTVASTGSIAPGDGGIESLDATAVTLQSGSILKLEINTGAATSDLLAVSGALGLDVGNGSLLQLSLFGTDVLLTPGTTFTLATYGSLTGGLFNYGGSPLVDDSTITLGLNQFIFSYNGVNGSTNALTLTAVPEPSTYALMGLGLGALAFLRRRRR